MTISVPSILPLDSILPDEPLLMMGAGPVPIPSRVAQANAIVINHLGATMTEVIVQVKNMSRYIFQTSSDHVMAVSGPGSAAMEMAITNLIFPDDEVLCVCNGYFSARMAEMVRRVGGRATILEVEEDVGIDPVAFEKELQKKKYSAVTIVQGETSNTVCNYQLPEISGIAKKNGCIVIVDAVCTLSTMELHMDTWCLDAVISGGQKGLSSIPGVSLLAFSKNAWKKIVTRKKPPSHWCFDALLAEQFWNKGGYHYTAPVSGILALHEALRLVGASKNLNQAWPSRITPI